MMKYNYETEVVGYEKAFNMFCDMLEIVGSVDQNENTTKMLLNNVPSDILEMVNNGAILLQQWIAQIQNERIDNERETI